MSLVFLHARWMILELLRQPSYVVSTVSFPALFYVIFALPESKDVASSNLLMASFSCFAVFGVIFLQFGVGIAQERTRTWYHYLRTLPVAGGHLMAARFLSALFFSVLAALKIVILALIFTEVELSAFDWVRFCFFLLMGGLLFCPMGLCLGYWASEKSSLPLGNLIYLPLSFAGGLWKPPAALPSLLKDVSDYLPTRHYGEVIWSVVDGKPVPLQSVYFLLAFGLLFALVAFMGSLRDYRARFV